MAALCAQIGTVSDARSGAPEYFTSGEAGARAVFDWHWDSFADFLAMGGYAPFVWGSYGVMVLVLAVELWSLRRRRKALASEETDK